MNPAAFDHVSQRSRDEVFSLVARRGENGRLLAMIVPAPIRGREPAKGDA